MNTTNASRFTRRLMLSGLAAVAAVTITGFVPARAATSPTVLITGASRGIGLELARQYAERGWNVIATCRTPADAKSLQEIAAKRKNLTIDALDVTDFAAVDKLAAKYKGKPIDVLLNNAGIAGDTEAQVFGKLKYDVYTQVHAVNVLGPLKVAEAFIDNVAASDQKKIMNITSTQGSIARVSLQTGTSIFYQSSKAALNMVMHSLALQLKGRGITVGLISPGFVKDDFTKGLDLPMMITPEQSATAVIKVIDDYTLDKAGTFMRQTGDVAPW